MKLNPADFVAKLRCAGAGTQSLTFRRQDATHYWRAAREAANLRLYRNDGSGESQIASTTITAADGDILHVVADSTNYIRVNRVIAAGTTNNTITTAAATNYATATAMAIGDEANYSEFEVYDRVQAGLAA